MKLRAPPALRDRVEDLDRVIGRLGDGGINRSDSILFITPEQPHCGEALPWQGNLRSDIEVVGVWPFEMRINARVRTAERAKQLAHFARLVNTVPVMIDPLILETAEAVGISKVEIPARQGRVLAGIAASQHEASQDSRRNGEARPRRNTVPGDQVW